MQYSHIPIFNGQYALLLEKKAKLSIHCLLLIPASKVVKLSHKASIREQRFWSPYQVIHSMFNTEMKHLVEIIKYTWML